MTITKKVPKKYQPKGFEILYEDRDLIIGNKAPGFLTVAAKWNQDRTIHSALNHYIRKGSSRSKSSVYVVHRLDQATTGVLVFAKTEDAQKILKDNWKSTTKTYYTIVHGKLKQQSGKISTYLNEDDDYFVHSSNDSSGKLAVTEYEVIKETDKYSLVKVNLVTGKKNQIRVHMAELGTPIVGDTKYGKKLDTFKNLCLHSHSLELTHPFTKKRLRIEAPIPTYFKSLITF
ncbi:MAG: RluA family pseudouridine synthase [Bdellovibrionales bacterium]|nr:RluA family pseudouridine synthase [Bdellovibrionales bacterium]